MKKSDFFFITVLLLGLANHSYQQGTCPQGWSQKKDSCYFAGQRFSGMTWYDAEAFCQAFGGHLVELNTADEKSTVETMIKSVAWSDGPWIGAIRLFGDSRWIMPSTKGQTNDNELNNQIANLATRATNDCGGYDRYGNNFGFWRCRNGGSPICEIDISKPADPE